MSRRLLWKIGLDLFVLACVALPSLFLLIWGSPHERGFFEVDTSIRLPYREETVTDLMQAAVGFGLIFVTVLAVEVVRDRRGKNVGEKYLGGVLVPGWLWETYTTVGIFTFGAAMYQLTSDSTKYAVGRLRPHFYDVCRPVYNASSPVNSLHYIQQFSCSAATEFQLKNIRLSFPSGHAGFGLYTAVFFSCYLQVKCRWHGSKLLRHGVQFLAFLTAWYVGLTRVVENYHHWDDVAFGYLVGAIYGFLIFIYVLKPKKHVRRYGLPLNWQESPPQTTVLPRPAPAR